MKPRRLLLLTVSLLLIGAGPKGDGARKGGEKRLSIRESLDRLDKAFARGADASVPLELTLGETFVVLRLKEQPSDVRISDPQVLDSLPVGPRSVVLTPRRAGSARLELPFGGAGPKKGFTLTLAVNVKPHPAKRAGEKRVPNRESLARLKRAFGQRADAEIPLDLTVGRPLVLPLKEKPFLLMTGDPEVMDLKPLNARSVQLRPLKRGRTPVAIWFGEEKDEKTHVVFTLKVRVWAKGR
jgi:Flp pilus assembly secretin CpaC